MATRSINLALQGGGAHGAFTWGVLEQLLAQSDLSFAAISGTSAGAMNAVVVAEGWRRGGREGARERLAEFWYGLAKRSGLDLLQPSMQQVLSHCIQTLPHLFSPYELNPLDINPLRQLLLETVDFEALQADAPFPLYIAATEVNSGRLRLFREYELDVERLLASACLPSIHKAIEVEGVAYWDGGFSANPALFPLVFDNDCADLLLVMLQPLQRDRVPRSARTINNRIAEIGFQAPLLRELASLAAQQQRAAARWISFTAEDRALCLLRFHLLESDAFVASQERESKYDTRLAFLQQLRERGACQAGVWLEKNHMAIGRYSSCDLARRFLTRADFESGHVGLAVQGI